MKNKNAKTQNNHETKPFAQQGDEHWNKKENPTTAKILIEIYLRIVFCAQKTLNPEPEYD